MKKLSIVILCAFALTGNMSCKKFLDINKDPDRLLVEQADLSQLLASATANVGFTGGSDLQRYTALIMQQYSGQSTGANNQTQDYDKYLITGADVNNLFSSIFATSLNDLEVIIKRGNELNAPHYTGVAKILKAYTYQIAVDAWGDLPYSEAQKGVSNLFPKYDDDVQIYQHIITLMNEGIGEVNQPTSTFSPGNNSLIYPGTFATTKEKWVKFANTLKLRAFLHYSKLDKTLLTNQMTTLVNNGALFMASNADNFQMSFFNESRRQNPYHQFEADRPNYLVAADYIVNVMNAKNDPRRTAYFTQVGGVFKGAKPGAPAGATTYSKLHTFLRGSQVGTAYSGTAPVRMLTFAEYNFIRAEAALYGVPGDVQSFFQAGIRASMEEAGVAAGDIATYLATYGTLTGTPEEMLKRIIEEKYIASFGVVMEPWTDWRRTGYPTITKAPNAVISDIPRSLFYPQNEVDLNPNAPQQKSSLLERVFWDK
ncbi:MAG TPA: SusD/RagB family nutrient-binding outer membrane lipoprotein [Flavisolibacter sp.]|nr:SusD/RagB family nutrient-binding outer membrane lipoprotein [Flavisolibacter sp.]